MVERTSADRVAQWCYGAPSSVQSRVQNGYFAHNSDFQGVQLHTLHTPFRSPCVRVSRVVGRPSSVVDSQSGMESQLCVSASYSDEKCVPFVLEDTLGHWVPHCLVEDGRRLGHP